MTRNLQRPAMRTFGALALITMGSAVLPGTSGQVDTANAAAAETMWVDSSAETQFVNLLNNLRATKGVKPLATDPELTANGRDWSITMRNEGRIFHTADQSIGVSKPWQKLGENVGTGPNVREVFDAFVASPKHYENLVDPAFDFVGIGVIWDGPRMWTVQRFRDEGAGAPPTAEPTPTTKPAPTTPAPTSQPASTTQPEPDTQPADTAPAATTTAPRRLPATEPRDTRTAGTAPTAPATSQARPRTAPPPDRELVEATAEAVAGITG
ncbi:MAG: CAP domain-containing protein [Microthrixaceae bacterium]